ncbi:TEA/ATTS domain family-domain-containing protein [Gongronella butleri]|nr:TEA/ATTS domain family-domain-containing protein [Gongronella butleri]
MDYNEGIAAAYVPNVLSKDRDEQVWPPDVEAVFLQAIEAIPKLGRRKILVNGKPCGRNELISDYIYRKTGKLRTRKQVSSHIQVLKNTRKNDPQFMRLLTDTSDSDTLIDPFLYESQTACATPFNFYSELQMGDWAPSLPSWPLTFDPHAEPALWPFSVHLCLDNSDATSCLLAQWQYQPPISIFMKDPAFLQIKCPWRDICQLVARLPPNCPFLWNHVTMAIPMHLIFEESQFRSSNVLLANKLRAIKCTTYVYSFGVCVLESTDMQQPKDHHASGYLYDFCLINPFFEAFLKGIRTLTTCEEVSAAIDHLCMVQLYEDANTNQPLLVVLFIFQQGMCGNIQLIALSR